MSLLNDLETILPLVSKPTRYLGNEFHVARKPAGRDTVQWCLILPEVYEIGMSHWGLKILYEILNRRPDSLAERCYSPWFDMEAQMRRHGIPLFSLESKKPVREFDFVGFSLQYELTYTNLLACLDLAGVPLRAEDRRDHDPLVIAGGPCTSNPEPLSDFCDLFLIGDGEEAVPEITRVYQGVRGRPRAEVLRVLSKVPGVYVPLMYEACYGEDGRLLGTRPRYDDVPARVQRQFIKELEDAPWPELPLVPLQGIVQDRLSVEVLRGCTQGCRFCQAGYLYRPVRERSAGKVLEIADRGIRQSGWDEVGLVSLSTADHTQLEPLADLLNARFGSDRVSISLPSLRADSFGVGIADKVRETRKTGFTFAPEAGSERLRLAMNKIIRDEEFFAAARVAYERGWRLIKMYFMVGLPTETQEDVEGIVRFVDTVRRIGREYGPSCSVNASVGPFVPKSHTPFQWDAFEDTESLKEKLRFLRRTVTTRWSRLKWHEVESSHLEAIFSLGDRRLGRVIEGAFRAGSRFNGWTEHLDYALWMRTLQEVGLDPATFTRARAFDEPLPWDHIEIGVLKKWLVRERKKTDRQEFEIGKSLVADCRHGDCTACGIPGLPYDTKLAPKLEEPQFRELMARAEQDAPRRQESGITWTVRFCYEKRGLIRFLSHLETGGVLARAFRMARVPLAHSQGHNPHPRLSFGPPLPVGFEGAAECFDAELLCPWNESIAAELNAVLPEGLRIRSTWPLHKLAGPKRPSLSAQAARARYAIDLAGLPAPRLESVRDTLTAFEAMETAVVSRVCWTPGSSREVTDWESVSVVSQSSEDVQGQALAPEQAGVGAGAPQRADAGARSRRARQRAASALPETATEDGAPEIARPVDLKQAIIRSAIDDAGSLDLELYLQHPSSQVANPRVVLEKLFQLSPPEQARVLVVRTALLDVAGKAIHEELP